MAEKAPARLAAAPLMLLAASALSGCAAVAIPIVAGGAVMVKSVEPAEKPQSSQEVKAAQKAAPSAPAAAPPPAESTAPAGRVPLASLQLTSFDPAFAQFAERALNMMAAHEGNEAADKEDKEAARPSALLADPVALDGERARCLADQPTSVLIDLDPAEGAFAPPARPAPLPEHGAVLASLREAGIIVGWISQNSVIETGAVRRALEQSGLDPSGGDVLLLIAGEDERKQSLRENFARSACIIAIAGDERADFDERFRYLRNPAAGAGLDRLIGDAWHLIRPLFPSTSSTGTPTP